MLVRMLPRINLKSSGRASLAQFNLLSFPVCVLSRRLNRISRADDAVWDGGVDAVWDGGVVG
jgi:hypothetical protein